jgi:carboxymethylenebutenolidase
MKKVTNADINQEMFDLYDAYAHNKIDRKSFIKKLAVYAVGGLTLPSLLSFMLPNYVEKIQIKGDDARLNSETISYSSAKGGGKINALLSKPIETTTKLPGIIVVHENRGLNPHIEDVARRAALAGFVTLAPDALSPLGGYPGNDDEGREMQKQRNSDEMLEDFIAAFEYLSQHPFCNGKIGVVGFCFGGSISNRMAARIPNLLAAVPFYGGASVTDEEVEAIQAELLLHFAELDTRVNASWPAYEESLKKYNKKYTAYIYPGVNHGFHNDTTPRYNEEAATLAWTRTIDFFTKKLG